MIRPYCGTRNPRASACRKEHGEEQALITGGWLNSGSHGRRSNGLVEFDESALVLRPHQALQLPFKVVRELESARGRAGDEREALGKTILEGDWRGESPSDSVDFEPVKVGVCGISTSEISPGSEALS